MTVEMLKAKRVMLISGYPGGLFEQGDIFIDSTLGYYFKENVLTEPSSVIQTTDVEKYPKLFKEVDWTVGRKDEDYPKYIQVYIIGYEGKYKVDGWQRSYPNGDLWTIVERDKKATRVFANQTDPITEEEYNSSLKPARSVAPEAQ